MNRFLRGRKPEEANTRDVDVHQDWGGKKRSFREGEPGLGHPYGGQRILFWREGGGEAGSRCRTVQREEEGLRCPRQKAMNLPYNSYGQKEGDRKKWGLPSREGNREAKKKNKKQRRGD